jgi:predicted transcriptional regulator
MAFTFRTDVELERILDALAAAESLSKQEIIRRAIIERFERAQHHAVVDDATERMVQRWGAVIERLGSA